MKKTIIVFLAILILGSCEEIMHVDLAGDSSRNLVIEGSITTDTTNHPVFLSYSGNYFDKSEIAWAKGADVSISNGDTVFLLTELADGQYYTDSTVYGLPGRTYTLNITMPDGTEYTGSDLLRPCVQIDSIRESANYNTPFGGYGYDVLFYGREPTPAGDYYLYKLYLNNELYTDTITEMNFASDEFVNGNYVRDFQVYRIREKDILSDSVKVTLEMLSITKTYYDFMSALMIETIWRGSPWDGPPANIPGNISNGATGFFRASAVQRQFTYFIPLPRAN